METLVIRKVRVLNAHERQLLELALSLAVNASSHDVSYTERQALASLIDQQFISRLLWAEPVTGC